MADKIIMPKTGMAMEEGVIIEWFIKEGDKVSKGDVVAEIETDKSTMELESDYEGQILKILYPAGSTVPVVRTIAWIGEPGEAVPEEEAPAAAEAPAADAAAAGSTASAAEVPAATAVSASVSESGRVKATPAARRAAGEKKVDLASVSPSGKHGEVREADVLSADSVSATPLAARIAADQQISLGGVAGSGHGGKVFKADILGSGLKSQNFAVSAGQQKDEFVKFTNIQKITGKRMLQSHTEVPVVTENTRADVTELLDTRKKLNESLGSSITINDFILLATARALRANPRVNSRLEGDGLLYLGNINLGMAVATERGLVVPVIPDADCYTISGLSAKAAEMAEKGRNGKLKPEEMQGGTFSVSNIGMYGVTSFTPIINQPEAGILGVCAIEDQLKMIDGEVVNRKIMGLSLTFDHRVVDGAEAAVFLKTIRDLLESPLTILA